MTRRSLLIAAGSLPALALAQSGTLRNLGGAPAGFPIRTRMAREANQPFDFVEYCHGLGLGVVETRLDPKDAEAGRVLRKKCEAYGMRLILDFRLPREAGDLPAFEAAMKAASEAGAFGLHTAMTGRRYEVYPTLEAFKKDFEQCQKSVALAEPLLRKYKMRLGIENHKGWRAAEQAAWLKRVSSEWVGVHFDFGNNLSLCEIPLETLAHLRPYVISCHIKDMAVEPYDDGFLLSEVPLGDGFLDLKGMVESLQAKDPNMPFNLEMITRDPLKIPVLTPAYWATFDDAYSPLPGRDLAGVLNIVRKNAPKSPLPRTTGQSASAQLKMEDENVAKSIEYARRNFRLA